MFSKLSFDEIESNCKHKLTSLEHWLRRLIDEIMTAEYGDYFNHIDKSGQHLIKKSIGENAAKRQAKEPDRYPRLIDAILLDDAIAIITNPTLYKKHFFKAKIYKLRAIF